MVPSLPAAACTVAGAEALPAAHAVDSRPTAVSCVETALSSACCALTTLACAAFTAATGSRDPPAVGVRASTKTAVAVAAVLVQADVVARAPVEPVFAWFCESGETVVPFACAVSSVLRVCSACDTVVEALVTAVCSGAVSKDASVWPARTVSPTPTRTAETVPATGNAADDRSAAASDPSAVTVCSTSARVTVASR